MAIFWKRIIITASAAVLCLLIGSGLILPDGGSVFREQRCISCHTFKGEGGMTGPDLTGVTKRRGYLWIMRQIKDPLTHNSDSRMPSYEHLSYFEILAVVLYLRG